MVVVVVVVGGGVKEDAPIRRPTAEIGSYPLSAMVSEPVVVLVLLGAAKRTLSVQVAPGGSSDPPTQVPPPWIVNWPGVTVIASSDADVRPVLRTVAGSVAVVPARIVAKSTGSTTRPGSRRRVNACSPMTLGPTSAPPASEIHATQRPLPDRNGCMCRPPAGPPLSPMLIVSVENGAVNPDVGP